MLHLRQKVSDMASKFQRRHYDAIAGVIGNTVQHYGLEAVTSTRAEAVMHDVVTMLGKMFARDNPSFSQERWWNACYPDLVVLNYYEAEPNARVID